MRKPLFLLLGLLALILGGGYLTLWLTTPNQRITMHTFERIQEGMTLADVEAIIGVPSGDYTTRLSFIRFGPPGGDVRAAIFEDMSRWRVRAGSWYAWIGDQGMIAVRVNGESKVAERGYYDVYPAEPSFLDRLR